MILTKEQFEKVKHLENDFNTAIESTKNGSGWVPMRTLKDNRTVQQIYFELTGEVLLKRCSNCRLEGMLLVGEAYFNYLDSITNVNSIVVDMAERKIDTSKLEETINKSKVIEENGQKVLTEKPKRGRKKKYATTDK